jgi:hypothetical protein
MTVTVVSRYTIANVPAATDVAKRARALLVRHGAQDARLSQIFTGPSTGQYIFAVVYADLAAWAKTRAGVMPSPEMQGLIAENARIGTVLQETEILLGVDI